MTTIIVPFDGYTSGSTDTTWDIEKIARNRKLAITSPDEVGTTILALDAAKRTLLFAKKDAAKARCLVIDLNNIDRCSIKKEYESINAGELKYKKLFHFIKRICINLGVRNSQRNVSLSLFDSSRDQRGNVEIIETKAHKWMAIVSKLLPVHGRSRIDP
jgi:hypothetical protein